MNLIHMHLPTIFLEDKVEITRLSLLFHLPLDGVHVKVVHDTVDKLLLRNQPVIQSLLAPNFQTPKTEYIEKFLKQLESEEEEIILQSHP